jgi:hypothetical protein
MRFACQSCGKAYNLPEERIADKSNVKLKCRVCGAIVEVKRQGELVAIVLDESEYKRGRVSEAPAPLTTLTPEDDADDGATVSIPEAALTERSSFQLNSPSGSLSVQLGLQSVSVPLPPAPLPPAASTGFSPSSLPPPPPLSRPEPGPSRLEPANLAPPLPSPLPPLSPPPPPLEMELPSPGMVNGSNGASDHFFSSTNGTDVAEQRSPRAVAPANLPNLPNVVTSSGMATNVMATLPEELPPPVERDDTMKKMLAAFLTGVLVDRLIAGLFF